MQNTLGGGQRNDHGYSKERSSIRVFFQYCSSMEKCTLEKFAQLSEWYVVVQDFPSIIGERKRLCNEIEKKKKLTKNSVFFS